jgi:hypothetical protein
MEDCAVVMALTHIREEILDGLRCFGRVEFNFDLALIGSEKDSHLVSYLI